VKLIVQNGSRFWGGCEKWMATLSRGLLDRGHDVIVSCAPGPVRARLEFMGVPTTPVRPRGDLDVVSAVAFQRMLVAEAPDALLTTSWTRQAWAAWAGRRARVPRVVARLGIVRSLPRRGPNTLAFRRWVDAMIVNAPEIRDEWERSAPFFPRERIHVVFNGIRPRDDQRAELRQRLRAELGVPASAVLIGGAGHLVARKGFDLLLRAFAGMSTAGARLVVVGGGTHADELRALAQSLGVQDRVHWLGPRRDGPEVVAGLDVFVLTSRNEGMANVMLEAMAADVPVVATNVSGVRSALGVEDGRAAGWIVEPEDVTAMSAALDAAAADDGESERRAAEALGRVHDRFGMDRMLAECEAVLFDPVPSGG
jgi:glycosyltransferase involved in cell wall biosynthesis